MTESTAFLDDSFQRVVVIPKAPRKRDFLKVLFGRTYETSLHVLPFSDQEPSWGLDGRKCGRPAFPTGSHPVDELYKKLVVDEKQTT